MSLLIVIPARKGSKSILSKNLKLFCGKPLIYWTIQMALDSKLGKVCVTTDGEDIRDYALSLGADVPFLRPENLSNDTVAMEPVVAHAHQHYAQQGIHFSQIMLLIPTSPFRRIEDLIHAKKAFEERPGCTAVFSVREAIANENPHWMMKIDEQEKVTTFMGGRLDQMKGRRQDLPKAYIKNDYVFLINYQNLFETHSNLYGSNPSVIVADENRIDVDINTPKDWLVAETLYKMTEAGLS